MCWADPHFQLLHYHHRPNIDNICFMSMLACLLQSSTINRQVVESHYSAGVLYHIDAANSQHLFSSVLFWGFFCWNPVRIWNSSLFKFTHSRYGSCRLNQCAEQLPFWFGIQLENCIAIIAYSWAKKIVRMREKNTFSVPTWELSFK